MKKILTTAVAALALAVSGACAGDEDIDTTAADESGSVDEYCTMSAELDAADAPPSEEELDEIVEVAPAEIKDDVRTLVEAVREQDFESEAAQEADQRLQEWEAEHCDRAADGGDGTGGGTGGTGDGTGDGTGTDGTEPDDGVETTDTTEDEGAGRTGGEGPSSGEPGEAGGDEGTDTTR